jgi:hypothetical protein
VYVRAFVRINAYVYVSNLSMWSYTRVGVIYLFIYNSVKDTFTFQKLFSVKQGDKKITRDDTTENIMS